MIKYFIFAILFLGATALLTAFICYRRVFAVTDKAAFDPYILPTGKQYLPHHKEMLRCIDRAVAYEYEDVYITSFDGVKLRGRYYEKEKGAPTQILFHGYQSNPLRDFSGGLYLAFKSGCNALLVDQRAHGKSGGGCLSFGVLERFDCLAWANFAAQNFGGKIILTGISMGGATVLMASELDLPEKVCGIISDCAYSSPEEIVKDVMKKGHYPVNILYPFVRLGGKLFGGFDLEESSPKVALKNSKVPVIFLHGEEDGFVPCEMSKVCFDACTCEKELFLFPGAGHGLSYTIDPPTYENAVISFIEKYAK